MSKWFMPHLLCNFAAWLAALAGGLCGLHAQPAGAAGAAPWFAEQFESRGAIEAAGGAVAEGVEFRPGKFGQAAFLAGGQTLRLPLALDGAGAWTLEFREWICWPAEGPRFRCAAPVLALSRASAPDAASLIVTHDGRERGYTRELGVHVRMPATNGSAAFAGMLSAACLDWPDARWQKISIAWSPADGGRAGEIRLYLNGELHDMLDGVPAAPPGALFDHAVIGPPGDAVQFAVDDLRLFAGQPEVSATPRNLVRNYSFEHDSNTDGIPDFWAQIGPPGKGYWGGPPGLAPADRGTSRRTEEDAFSGRHALRMESRAPGVGGQAIVTIFGFEPGREYTLDAAVKAAHPRLSLMLSPFDMAGNLMGETKKTFNVELPLDNLDRWTLLSESVAAPLRFRAPAGCRYAHLYLLVYDRQSVYWDDLYCIASSEGEAEQ